MASPGAPGREVARGVLTQVNAPGGQPGADIDLLVMGAYGHSRLRELVLGGVTRQLFQQMTVPVLMSH